MVLDVGELRARVVVDRSQVRPGLADVRRQVQQATDQLSRDTDRAGEMAGRKLGDGLASGTVDELRRHRRQLASAGDDMGGDVEDGLKRADSRLQRIAGRIGYSIGRSIHVGAKTGAAGLGSAFDITRGVLTRGAGDLARFSAGGVLAFGAVTAAAAGIGTSVASSNEQAVISFTTMLKKGDDTAQQAHDRAVSFIGDLQQLAATTPFEFADLQDYASSLVSAGIETDKIIPIMKNLGDVTSGVGTGAEGIDRATVALQQMIAAQKISAEDLNQLRDAGIPVYDLLAGATGKSKGEIVKLAQSGKLGKEELDKLIDTLSSDAPKGLERFSGLMSKQSQSLKGQLSNLSDTVQQGLGRVATRAMPQIKRGLEGVSEASTSVFSYLDKHGDSIERIFRAGGRTVESFGNIVKPVLGAFFGEVAGGQDTLDALADWLDTHQEDLVTWFVNGARGAVGFGKAVAGAASVGLRAYAGLADGVGDALDFILKSEKKIVDAAASAADALGLGSQADKLRNVSGALQGMIDKNATDDAGAAKARQMADAIDGKLLPALDKADRALEKYGDRAKKSAAEGDAWRGALQGVTRSVEKNGKSLDSHTKAGKANRAAIKSATDALVDDAREAARNAAKKGDLKDAEKAAAKVIRDGTRDIRDQAKKAGLNSDAVKDMTRKLNGVPGKIKTEIEFQTNAQKVLVKLRAQWGKAQGVTKGNQALANMDKNATGRARGGLVELAAGLHDGGIAGGMVPGRTPLSRGDDYLWPMRDGRKQPLRGGEGVQVTEAMDAYEQRRLHAMNAGVLGGLSPQQVRKNLGEHTAQTSSGRARGGLTDVPGVTMDVGPAATAFARQTAKQTAEAYAEQTRKTLQAALDASRAAAASASAGLIDVNNPRGLTTWGGGRFTNLFAANLARAQKMAGTGIPVIQGGFRPATSYSGTSHAGDALDTAVNYRVLRALRAVGIATGDRTGLGNWGPHMHAVPTKGAGFGGGSAVWQAQDYMRRGGASQGPRSPWGLAYGGIVDAARGYATGTGSAARGFAWTGEKGAELVVNPQVRSYQGGERVLNPEQTRAALGGRQAPLVGQVTFTEQSGTRDDLQQLDFYLRGLEVGRNR